MKDLNYKEINCSLNELDKKILMEKVYIFFNGKYIRIGYETHFNYKKRTFQGRYVLVNENIDFNLLEDLKSYKFYILN